MPERPAPAGAPFFCAKITFGCDVEVFAYPIASIRTESSRRYGARGFNLSGAPLLSHSPVSLGFVLSSALIVLAAQSAVLSAGFAIAFRFDRFCLGSSALQQPVQRI